MDADTAVIVGAAIGAAGGVLGAFLGWAGTRAQARAGVEVARVESAAQQQAEAATQRRAAYAAVGANVEAVRKACFDLLRVMDMPVLDTASDSRRQSAYDAAEAERTLRVRDLQTAEWPFV